MADVDKAGMDGAQTPWRCLGELFVERGLITSDDFESAIVAQAESGGQLGAILVERGLLSESDLTDALVEQVGAAISQDETGALRTQLEEARTELDRLREMLADAMTALSALIAEDAVSHG
jgi:hypothetical protein